MRNLSIEQVMTYCRLTCGSEAVAHGFPPEAGHDTYDGCVADDIEGWDEQTFLDWTHKMDEKYGTSDLPGINSLMKLYGDCSKIMGRYGGMLKSAKEMSDG